MWKMSNRPKVMCGYKCVNQISMSPTSIKICTVYCNQAHYGPLSGSVAEARVKSGHAVVGAGQIEFWGYTDGGSGGGT